MRIEFNLVPAEYFERPSAWKKIFSPQAAAALIFLCAAEFFAVSFFMLPRLRAESEGAASERDAALKKAVLLAGRYDELHGEEEIWKNFLAAAESGAPAYLILAQLLRDVPEAASLEAFTIDDRKFQAEILFAGADGVNSFMRRMEKLPYGPMRVLERRFIGQRSLLFRFEAPRRNSAKTK